jgi:hypothetical protein
MFVVVKEARASVGFAPSPNGDCAPSGSGGMELPSLGSGEALPDPKGSDVQNLCPRCRACQTYALGVERAGIYPLGVGRGRGHVLEREFPFFGYPKLGT